MEHSLHDYTAAAGCYLRAAVIADTQPRTADDLAHRAQHQRESGYILDASRLEEAVQAMEQDPIGDYYGRLDQGGVKPPQEWPFAASEWQPSTSVVDNLLAAQNYIVNAATQRTKETDQTR